MTFFPTLVAALLGVLAAFTAAWISRSVKISEFRQKWIDELRSDIATYLGLAEKWHRKWDEINLLPSEETEKREREEAFPIANDAMVVLWRIKLRINPEKNDFQKQDEEFIQSLVDMLNPGQAFPSWRALADVAVEKSRKLMKREWEVTKRVQLPCPRDFDFQCRK